MDINKLGAPRDFPGGSEVKHLPTMRETWVRFLGQEDLLEKKMATYSSILAQEIPWTEEPAPGVLCPWGHKQSETTE